MKIRIATYNVHGWVDEQFDSNLDRVSVIVIISLNIRGIIVFIVICLPRLKVKKTTQKVSERVIGSI